MNLDYKIINGFSVYGAAGIAIVAGTSSVTGYAANSAANTSKSMLVTPIYSGDLGLKWCAGKVYNNYGFNIKVGYHLEDWKSVIKDSRQVEQVATSQSITEKDLYFSGAYLQTTLEF